MSPKRTYYGFSTPQQRKLLFETWEEISSVTQACRKARSSRGLFYYWKHRFDAAGYAGLEDFESRVAHQLNYKSAAIEQRDQGPVASRVANRLYMLQIAVRDHTKNHGMLRTDVAAEGPRQNHALHGGHAPLAHEQLGPGVEGGLRQLNCAHVVLSDDDLLAAGASFGPASGACKPPSPAIPPRARSRGLALVRSAASFGLVAAWSGWPPCRSPSVRWPRPLAQRRGGSGFSVKFKCGRLRQRAARCRRRKAKGKNHVHHPQIKSSYRTPPGNNRHHEAAIPFLRLRGLWLATAGFRPGDTVAVTVEHGRLVLTAPNPGPAPIQEDTSFARTYSHAARSSVSVYYR